MKLAENLPEKCWLRLPTHLCSFREGQQHSRGWPPKGWNESKETDLPRPGRSGL